MEGKFRFLGTGGSMGVPVIGCRCQVCQSSNPKNKRLRSSGLLEINNRKILIDCGPDFRQQALTYGITEIDGVIVTHPHYDHTSSIDELRVFYMRSGKPIPCLVSKETHVDFAKRFDYIFSEKKKGSLLPKIDLVELPFDRGSIEFEGLQFKYFTYEQVNMKVIGFRIGNFAYLTDIRDYPDSIYKDLKGIEVLVVSALRFTSSHIHFSIDEAIDFAKEVNPKQTWLTHISHEVEYDHVNAYLPRNIRSAYDGLEIEIRE